MLSNVQLTLTVFISSLKNICFISFFFVISNVDKQITQPNKTIAYRYTFTLNSKSVTYEKYAAIHR